MKRCSKQSEVRNSNHRLRMARHTRSCIERAGIPIGYISHRVIISSSERVGRKDWINLLISVLVGIVISAALPPEATRELFRFVGDCASSDHQYTALVNLEVALPKSRRARVRITT